MNNEKLDNKKLFKSGYVMENCIFFQYEKYKAWVPILVWEKIAIYLFLGDQTFRKPAVF